VSGWALARATPVSSALAALLVAASLAGCGSGSDTSSIPTSASGAETAPQPEGGRPAGNGSSDGGGGTAAERDSDSKPGSKSESHFEGGEEDVEEFGTEAEGAAKDAAFAAEQRYLSAVAGRDYAEACTLLSKSLTGSLEAMVKPGRKLACGQILGRLLSPTASRVSAQQAEGEVFKVRVEGDRAIVVFRAPGARLWALPLSREGGAWKVTTLGASILAPSAATLGE
jgi:hypothetical protein